MADISETSFDKTAETWLTNSEFSELKNAPQNAGRREGVRDFKVTFFCWLEVSYCGGLMIKLPMQIMKPGFDLVGQVIF